MVIIKWIKGFINHPFKILYSIYLRTLNKQEYLAIKRLEICKKCSERETLPVWGDVCQSCGCILANKTRLETEQCDMNKW